jgi:hypothetical protein
MTALIKRHGTRRTRAESCRPDDRSAVRVQANARRRVALQEMVKTAGSDDLAALDRVISFIEPTLTAHRGPP